MYIIHHSQNQLDYVIGIIHLNVGSEDLRFVTHSFNNMSGSSGFCYTPPYCFVGQLIFMNYFKTCKIKNKFCVD